MQDWHTLGLIQLSAMQTLHPLHSLLPLGHEICKVQLAQYNSLHQATRKYQRFEYLIRPILYLECEFDRILFVNFDQMFIYFLTWCTCNFHTHWL